MQALINIFSRIELWPHFRKYYSERGIDQFIVGVWQGKDNPLWAQMEREPGIVLEPSFTGAFSGLRDAESQNRLREKYVGSNDWFVIADLDEFHFIPGFSSFKEIAKAADSEDAEIVTGEFVDRITEDGHIPDGVDGSSDLFEQFPRDSHITRDIAWGYCQKLIMAKGHCHIDNGHHFFPENTYRRFTHQAIVYHFKWHGNVAAYLRKRIEDYKALNLQWYVESEKVLEHLARHDNKLSYAC